MRKLTVTMRPRKGGVPTIATRTMNDRYTESCQLQLLIKDILRAASEPLKLSDYHIVSV